MMRMMNLILCFSLFSLSSMAMPHKKIKHKKNLFVLAKEQKTLAARISRKRAKKFLREGMLPIGSSAITDAGDLYQTGIKGILHAASGSMTRHDGIFKPSLYGVKESIKNSLKLAKDLGYQSIAIPFIGGGIFLGSIGISKDELAYEIAKTTVDHSRGLRVTLIGYTPSDEAMFQRALDKALKKYSRISKWVDSVFNRKSADKRVKVAQGSIIDFNVHQCELIVNPANTEVSFGGGLSGVIGRATGSSYEIDQDAQELIQYVSKKL